MVKKVFEETIDHSSVDILTPSSIPNTINDLLATEHFKGPYQRYSTYGSNSHKWSRKETQYFFQLLTRYGTDFSIMAANYLSGLSNLDKKLGKKRSKKQLLNKYKKQEKNNHERVALVLDASWKQKAFGQIIQQQTPKQNLKQCKRKRNLKTKFEKKVNQDCVQKFNQCLIKTYSTSVSQNSSIEQQEYQQRSWQNLQKCNNLCQV